MSLLAGNVLFLGRQKWILSSLMAWHWHFGECARGRFYERRSGWIPQSRAHYTVSEGDLKMTSSLLVCSALLWAGKGALWMTRMSLQLSMHIPGYKCVSDGRKEAARIPDKKCFCFSRVVIMVIQVIFFFFLLSSFILWNMAKLARLKLLPLPRPY